MAKDPAFLFYSADFLVGTALMSETEVGQYVKIMCHIHQSGHLTMEDMKNICPNISAKVVSKFKKDKDGKFFNERLEEEIQKRKKYSESRRNNRLKKKTKTHDSTYDKTYVNHMSTHMENENEDVNEITNTNTNKVISKNEIFNELFTDEIWVEQIGMTHKDKDLKQAWEECYTHHSANPNAKRFQTWEWKQKLNSWLTIKKSNDWKSAKKINGANSPKFSGDYSEAL